MHLDGRDRYCLSSTPRFLPVCARRWCVWTYEVTVESRMGLMWCFDSHKLKCNTCLMILFFLCDYTHEGLWSCAERSRSMRVWESKHSMIPKPLFTFALQHERTCLLVVHFPHVLQMYCWFCSSPNSLRTPHQILGTAVLQRGCGGVNEHAHQFYTRRCTKQ